MDFRNKRVTVMGLGSFGGQIAAIQFLADQGARQIIVTDTKPATALADSLAQIADVPNVTLRLGGHVDADFSCVDAVVVSPAVPKSAPQLAAARAAGVPLTSEMNLFFERCRGRIVGITGSAGKSTTTAMIEGGAGGGRPGGRGSGVRGRRKCQVPSARCRMSGQGSVASGQRRPACRQLATGHWPLTTLPPTPDTRHPTPNSSSAGTSGIGPCCRGWTRSRPTTRSCWSCPASSSRTSAS